MEEPDGIKIVTSTARIRRRRRAHRRLRWIAIATGVAVLLLALGGAAAAYLGKQHADQLQTGIVAHAARGAAELETGRDLVSRGNKDRSADDLRQSSLHFGRARTEFKAARQLADGDPLVRGAEALPGFVRGYVKPRVDTLDALCDMGVALADAGDAAAGTDALLIAPAQGHGGAALLTLLTSVEPQVEQIRSHLKAAAAAATRVAPALLPRGQRRTFEATRASVDGQLRGVEEFERLTPVIREVLGGNGQRTYLIANADPANLQGSGGFVGSFSIMTTNNGEMKIDASGDVASIDQPYPKAGQKGYIAPPTDLQQFADHGWRLGDGLVQSDFGHAGSTLVKLYANETGRTVDGAIAIDPVAVAMLLQVTGPISVPEYRTTVSYKDFADLVFQKEECRSCGYAYDGKKFISTASAHIISQLLNLPTSSWGNLMSTLNGAATQRHLQLYFTNQQVEDEMNRVGWSGAPLKAPPGGELFREVENNYGDSKANHFIQRRFTLALSLDASGNLSHHLVVMLKNPTPAGYSGGQLYRCYIRLYVPDTATDPKIGNVSGNKIPSTEQPPAGLKFMDGWFQINAFGTQEIPFDWTTKATDLKAGHRIYWQKQAGTNSDPVEVTFTFGGRTYKVTTDLQQDRILVLGADGVRVDPGLAGGAALPTIGS